MIEEEAEKKREMIEKMFGTYQLYLSEAKSCCDALRKVNCEKWPERVLKTDVDELRGSIVSARSKLKTSRVLLDSLIESYQVYNYVFPEEKPAIQPQPSASAIKN